MGSGEAMAAAAAGEWPHDAVLAAIENHSTLALIGFTRDGDITRWSRGAQRLFGYPRSEMVGLPLQALWPQTHRGEVPGLLQRVLGGRVVDTFETERVDRNGRRVEVEASMCPVRDTRGEVVGGVSLEHDIRARKRQERRLQRSETRLRLIAENTQDLVFIADERRRFIYANPAFERLLGLNPRQLLGSRWLALLHPQDRRNLATEPPSSAHEFRLTDADGHWHWVEGTCQPIDAAGSRHTIGTLHPIGRRKQREAELQHQAWHDPLTGVANRVLFIDRLERVIARSRFGTPDYAVALLDLDDFKRINDSHGHARGDRVLIEFTHRVQRVMRPTDTLARLGGDEFALLLERAGGRDGVDRIARRICSTLSTPFACDDTLLPCVASIGVALGTVPATPHDLLRRADRALYRAKAAGKARFAFY